MKEMAGCAALSCSWLWSEAEQQRGNSPGENVDACDFDTSQVIEQDKEKGDLELHFGFRFLTLPTILFLIWPLKALP